MNTGGQRRITIRNERFRKRKRYSINISFIVSTAIVAFMYNIKQNVESHSFFRASAVHLGPRPPIFEVSRSHTDTRGP